ncbi:MAG: hypothetical protein K2K74_15065 [Lachnospiraceae bacterium]|nr:hypothetical protein [Lachnospiraceae bacterium]
MRILHSEKNTNIDKRKKALELIEFFVVVFLCIMMYFHERGTVAQPDVSVLPVLGDRVLFGTYLNEPIAWRVIQVDENGEAVLIAENILTMKAFNAADSGIYNFDDEDNSYWSIHETEADKNMELQAYVRGNSRWADSDLRAWLNSDRENVVYDGIGPVMRAMSEEKNGYVSEPGFLNGFTVQEREAIVPTENVTNGNALDGEEVHSTDLVYLLSEEELAWLMEADVSIRTKPTEQAIEQDQTHWYNMHSLDFGVEEYYWWLREPVSDMSSNCYMVDNGYTARLLRNMPAGAEGIGVRPAVKVDTKKITLSSNECESGESKETEESGDLRVDRQEE